MSRIILYAVYDDDKKILPYTIRETIAEATEAASVKYPYMASAQAWIQLQKDGFRVLPVYIEGELNEWIGLKGFGGKSAREALAAAEVNWENLAYRDKPIEK